MLSKIKFSLIQLAANIICTKKMTNDFNSIKTTLSGKNILLCGAGPSLKKLDTVREKYEYMVGVNGLIRFFLKDEQFKFFILEDVNAYKNYCLNIKSKKIILASGLRWPDSSFLYLPFVHRYSYPHIKNNPKFSSSARWFYWGDGVVFFALSILNRCNIPKLGLLGFDLSEHNGRYFSSDYRTKHDAFFETNFEKQRKSYRYALKNFNKTTKVIIYE